MQSTQPTTPIIVDIGDKGRGDVAGLADVLIGSLGLAGVGVLLSVVLAALFAAVVFWWRSRAEPFDPAADREQHIV